MEIINQSRCFMPIGMDPLKRIELIGKVCTKKEHNITDESATKFFVDRIKQGHCAIAEHGIEYFIIETDDDKSMHNLLNVIKHFKYIDYKQIHNEVVIAINYRVIIDVLLQIVNTNKKDSVDTLTLEYFTFIGRFLMYNNIHKLLYDDVTISHIENMCSSMSTICYGVYQLNEYDVISLAPEILHLSIKFVTDRGVSHEFVRHKIASFMQESTRWCKYDKGIVFIRPYWMTDEEFNKFNELNLIEGSQAFSRIDDKDLSVLSTPAITFIKQCLATERNYATLLCSINQAQAARAVLGQSVKTEIWITATLNRWQGYDYSKSMNNTIKEKKGIIPQRTAKEAHPDMQIAMNGIVHDIESILQDAKNYEKNMRM